MKTKLLKAVLPAGPMPYYLVEFEYNNEKKILRTDIKAYKYNKDELMKQTKKEWKTGRLEKFEEREAKIWRV